MVARALTVLCLITLATLAHPALADEAQDALVEQGVQAYDDGDYQKAKDILLPLAKAGVPKAMNMIGLMHDFGKGYPENTVLGCDWYQRSAKTGYVSAQSNLSTCYSLGDGRPKDMKKFLYWSQKAAEQGSKSAQGGLAAYYVDRDREQYLYWAQKAAAQGSITTKALMWGNGDKALVPHLRWTDLACVVVMIGWLDKPYDYCD